MGKPMYYPKLDKDLFVGYNEWAHKKLKIEIKSDLVYQNTTGTDRGVFISEDIRPGQEILSIPFQSLLTIESIGEIFPGDLVSIIENQKNIMHIREDDLLACFLMYERYIRRKESKWYQHIRVLPETYENMLYFDQDCFNALKGSNLAVLGKHLQIQVQEDYRQLNNDLLQKIRCHVSDQTTQDMFTLEQYKWALGVIWSRFVTIRKGDSLFKAMAPVFDMFNHDPKAEMSHGFEDASGCLKLISNQRWEAGSQMCINYGPLSNHRLAMLYGFVLLNNPFDSIEIWATINPEAQDYQLKNQILESRGIDHANTPFEISMDNIPQELLSCIRIQRITDEDLPAFHKAFEGEIISKKNEQETLNALVVAFQTMLDGYDTSIEEDEAMLDLWAVPEVLTDVERPSAMEEMSIKLRLSDKRILYKNLSMLHENLDKLK